MIMTELNPKNPYSNEMNFSATVRDNTLKIDLKYPDINKIKYLEFNQESVRASDGIRISYEYDRDGYKIEQASKFQWDCDDTVCDRDWQEVAFIPAWDREKKDV